MKKETSRIPDYRNTPPPPPVKKENTMLKNIVDYIYNLECELKTLEARIDRKKFDCYNFEKNMENEEKTLYIDKKEIVIKDFNNEQLENILKEQEEKLAKIEEEKRKKEIELKLIRISNIDMKDILKF